MSDLATGGSRYGITEETLAIVDAILVMVSKDGSMYKPPLASIEFVFLDGGASGFTLEKIVSSSIKLWRAR